MSFTLPGGHHSPAAVHKIMKSFTAQRTERERGRDRGVRRYCVDENDPSAKPWEHNRFASQPERVATIESLLEIAKALQAKGQADFPDRQVAELRAAERDLAAELDELMARSPAERPIGRPAAIRIELEKAKALLAEAALKITRTDVDVLEAYFRSLKATGEWTPSWEKVAENAACCVRSVGRALKRLKHHGLLNWIARSRRTGNDGEFAPQREQTSHAYFLDFRKGMAAGVYHRFLQLRENRLKRLHAARQQAAARNDVPTLVKAAPSPLDLTLASLGALIDKRDGPEVRV